MSAADKRTASQRIEDLEKAVMSAFQVTNNMARENNIIKDALKLLATKIEAIMRASRAGEPLTDEVISRIMLEIHVEELQGKVKNLINQGILVPVDSAQDNTFIVGTEIEADGKVAFPRSQFTFGSLEKPLQDILRGKKIGETVLFREDRLRLVLKEVYNIVAPKAPETEAEAEGTPEAKAAPATDAATASVEPTAAQSLDSAAPVAPAADQPGQGAGN